MIRFLIINLIIFNCFSDKSDKLLINSWINMMDEFHFQFGKNGCVEMQSQAPLINKEELGQVAKVKPKNIVKKCLAKKRKSHTKSVSYQSFHHCSPTIMISDNVNYDITITKGKNSFIKIGLNILLESDEDDDVFEKVKATKTCVQQIYANQGLYLDLNFTTDKTPTKIHHSVNLYSYYADTNSKNWGVNWNSDGAVTPEFLCVTVAHELAHTLGLGDTYFDPRCNFRKDSKNPNALMRILGDPTKVELEESEIATIVEPICGVIK